MKTVFFFLLLFFNITLIFPQKSPANALRFDGVYFTKPSRQSPQDVWAVRCLRFYQDKTVILTSEVYPDQGFDMSRFESYFSKEHLPPETARGKYTSRNDSLVFSTEAYFTGETKRHTIKNQYSVSTITPDSLRLERRTQYDETETRTFYFRAFRKAK